MTRTLSAEVRTRPVSVRIAGVTLAVIRVELDSDENARELACGGTTDSSSIQNCQPGGAGGHEGSGCHPEGGVQSAGGAGQFGGQLYRFEPVPDMPP